MNISLVESLAQAVLSLSPEEQQHFEQVLRQKYAQDRMGSEKITAQILNFDNQPYTGMWADREDMQDSHQWVRNLRQRWSSP